MSNLDYDIYTAPLGRIHAEDLSPDELIALFKRIYFNMPEIPSLHAGVIKLLAFEAASAHEDKLTLEELQPVSDKMALAVKSCLAYLKGDEQKSMELLEQVSREMGFESLTDIMDLLENIDRLIEGSTQAKWVKKSGGRQK